MTTARVMIRARPMKWTRASFSGAMRLPRRAISRRTKAMRPPASMGRGGVVEWGRVEGEEGGKVKEALPPGLLDDLAGSLGDADRSGDIGAGPAFEHGDNLVAGKDQGVQGGGPALRDGLPGGEALGFAGLGVEIADANAGGALARGWGPAGLNGKGDDLRATASDLALDGEGDDLAQ